LSTMVTEVDRLLRSSEPFVYAYYDGLDKVAHEYGLGEHYDAELRWVDHTIDRLVDVLPPRAALLVTADHGQVEVGGSGLPVAHDVLELCSMQSGEGRFRWLHARPGRAGDLLEAARANHGEDAWVVSRNQVVDDRWLGPVVTEAAA